MVRRIGLDRKHAKLKVLEELAKSRQAKARADAEAPAAKAKLEAEEAETLAEYLWERLCRDYISELWYGD